MYTVSLTLTANMFAQIAYLIKVQKLLDGPTLHDGGSAEAGQVTW